MSIATSSTSLIFKLTLKNQLKKCLIQTITTSTSKLNLKLNTNEFKNENRILTIPNVLTLSRICMTPFINYYLLTNDHKTATILFAVAGFTDFLDGYIARNYANQKSYLGSIIDPLADKLLICSLTITLTKCSLIPIELMFIILTRDLILILSSLIIRYKLIDKPKTLKKYLNISKYSTVKIEADQISKFNTLIQIILITATIPSGLFNYNQTSFMFALQCLTALTTISSSISYLLKRGSYRLVK